MTHPKHAIFRGEISLPGVGQEILAARVSHEFNALSLSSELNDRTVTIIRQFMVDNQLCSVFILPVALVQNTLGFLLETSRIIEKQRLIIDF